MLTQTNFVCCECRQSFPRTGQWHKFCSTCAAQQGRHYSKRQRERKNGGHFGHRPKSFKCEGCQRSIVSLAHNRRYCDEECRANARRARVIGYRHLPRGFINHRMSSAIRQSLVMGKQGHHWEKLVGYTLADLMAHLERQFVDGMTWDNRGDWHIDHVRPLCSFEFQTPECPQFREAWALSNLQPLWGPDNLKKGGRWTPPA